jgi:cytochrome P450
VTQVTDHVGVTHVVVTSHRLIKQVLADPETFGPDNALDAISPMPVSALRVLAAHRFRLPPTLANNGGRSHPKIREITSAALSLDRVNALRPWLSDVVRERARAIRKRLAAGETVDLYADLAADLPLLVLARLVELPQAHSAVVKEFSRAALELFWAPVDEARQVELAEIVGRFHLVLREFTETAGGMVGRLREHASEAGLHKDTPIGALFFLLVAGQETTSQFLTLLLHRLAMERAVLEGLGAGSVHVDDVVEEGLRLVPPIPTWRRVAKREVTLDGVRIARGRSIVLWLSQAGHEIARAGFVPGQPGSRKHLAFGAGAHRCVGAQLARMEAGVVVEHTAALLRNVRIVREPWCPDNLSFRMPDTFLVVSESHSPASSRGSSQEP